MIGDSFRIMQKILILWDIDGTIIRSGKGREDRPPVALMTCSGISGISLPGSNLRGARIFGSSGNLLPEVQDRAHAAERGELCRTLRRSPAGILGGRARTGSGRAWPTYSQGRPRIPASPRASSPELAPRGAGQARPSTDCGIFSPSGPSRTTARSATSSGPTPCTAGQGPHWGVDFPPERTCGWSGTRPTTSPARRAFGARALAVATGGSTAARLRSDRPDAVLESLGDTAAFWRRVGL